MSHEEKLDVNLKLCLDREGAGGRRSQSEPQSQLLTLHRGFGESSVAQSAPAEIKEG